MIIIICPCGNKVTVKPSRATRTKYCSKKCLYQNMSRPSGLKYKIVAVNKGWFEQGDKAWNTGVMEEKSHSWKGDQVKYDGLHDWVERKLGKPRKCDICGTTKAKVFQWSNKSGKYLRKLSDWQRLCVKCHQRYDYEKFGARKKFYR